MNPSELTMPPAEVMYSLARRLKERAKAVPDTWGSDSTQESLSNKAKRHGKQDSSS